MVQGLESKGRGDSEAQTRYHSQWALTLALQKTASHPFQQAESRFSQLSIAGA